MKDKLEKCKTGFLDNAKKDQYVELFAEYREDYPDLTEQQIEGEVYIEELFSEYRKEYPDFTEEQIEKAALKIIGEVNYQLQKATNSYVGQLKRMYVMGRLVILKEIPAGIDELFYLRKGSRDEIILYLEERGIAMPDDEEIMDKYLKFIPELTDRIIDDICCATKQKIPQESIDEYLKVFEEVRSNVKRSSENLDSTSSATLEPDDTAAAKKYRSEEDTSEDAMPEDTTPTENNLPREFSEKLNISLKAAEGSSSSTSHSSSYAGEAINTPIEIKLVVQEKSSDGETEDFPDLIIENTLSWISDLPGYLQEQILNSYPVLSLIESLKESAKMLNSKTIDFTLFNQNNATNNHDQFTSYRDDNAVIQDSSYQDPFDKGMILGDNVVSITIMPMGIEGAAIGNGLIA